MLIVARVMTRCAPRLHNVSTPATGIQRSNLKNSRILVDMGVVTRMRRERGWHGMESTGQGGMRVIHRVELEDWSGRVSRPWSPIMAAGRQFNALLEAEDVPCMAAYDVLYELANLALQWLEDNPCPDKAVGRHFTTQMTGYRAVADTV